MDGTGDSGHLIQQHLIQQHLITWNCQALGSGPSTGLYWISTSVLFLTKTRSFLSGSVTTSLPLKKKNKNLPAAASLAFRHHTYLVNPGDTEKEPDHPWHRYVFGGFPIVKRYLKSVENLEGGA